MAGYDSVSLYGDNPPRSQEDIEKSIRKKFKHDLEGRFEKAVVQYGLIEEGDHIAVCISGGKDSMLMAKLFQEIKRHNKFPFKLTFLCMDPGYLPENRALIEENCRLLGIPVTIFDSPIFDSVFHIEKSPCYLCARMRRGYLYSKAKELGCNKIALGHHLDDVAETFMMNLLRGGTVDCFSPVTYLSRKDLYMIRPMIYARESDCARAVRRGELPVVKSKCPADGVTAREQAKQLLNSLEKEYGDVRNKILGAMQRKNINGY